MTDAGNRARVEDILEELRDLLTEDGDAPGDDDNLIEWGLESITLMSRASRWRRDGFDINFGELAAEPTLRHWRTLLLAARGGPAVESTPSEPTERDAPAVDEPFGLAALQHAYWIGRQDGQQLGGVAAHLYTEFDGHGVDPDRLTEAVEAVLRRHPMLRMTVRGDGSQQILPVRDHPPVTVVDLRTAAPDDAQARLESLRQSHSHQRLDIEAGQVFDIALTLLPEGRTRLHVDVDMVAADARSYRVLLADLAAAYSGSALPAASDYTYPRYLAEHELSAAPKVAADADWWSRRVDTMAGAPELPLNPNAADPERTGRRARWLSAEMRDRLSRRAREHGLTLAMALACVYAEVIGGWSGRGRFLLNVPLFDREPLHPDIEGLVGDFTSSVLLDVDVTAPAEFADRARQLQAQLHERAEHSAFSGVQLLRELTRARGEQVVAPVVFTSALGLGELFHPSVRQEFGAPVWILSQGPQVLLDAQVTELDGGVLVNWDVRENLLAPGVPDAMFAAFGELLDRLAADDRAWREPFARLVGPDQRQARDRANDTAVDRPARCLHTGFFERLAETPDAPALLWGESDAWTYAELGERALRVAAALGSLGMRPGEIVAVSLPKGPEQIAAILGVLAGGGTYLPIGWDQPDSRVQRILEVAGSRYVITDRLLPGTGAELSVLDSVTALNWPESRPEPILADPNSTGYVLFTSGSTGEPKGVEVPHASAMNTIDDLLPRYGIGPGDRSLGVSAMEFDLSVFDVFGLLSAGGAVVVVRQDERDDARVWTRLVRTRGVTVINCVPALLDMLLVMGQADGLGSAPRLVLLGGDWVGVDLPGRLAEQLPDCRFVGLGGTTETAIHSTRCEVRDADVPADWRAVPYGTPLDNVMCRVVDEQGRDRPDWAVGELWIGGSGVASGYRGDPDRTAAKFPTIDGVRWYRTGDLARYWSDGTLEFLGRADHQVKLRGYRIELGEVEAALATLPGAGRAVARLDTRRGGSLQALVAGDPALTEPALRDGVAGLLPAYMVPDRIVVTTELPLTRNGKPDRNAIAALLDRAERAAQDEPAEPTGALERLLLMVWRDVLENPSLGVADDFLAGGGDSVLATRIVAQLRESMQSDEIRVRDVLAGRTVAAMAAGLRDSAAHLEDVAAISLEVSALSEEDLDLELR